MFRLEWLFFMQLCMGILMILFLRKLTQMKRQVEEITREVTNYISYITEDMEEGQTSEIANKPLLHQQNISKDIEKNEKEEAQNRLIQAVLQEYFP